MLINAPGHTLAARPFLPGQSAGHTSGALDRVLKRIQGIVCGLHGHDSILQYERDRLSLVCTSCGHQTPGWEVTPRTFAMKRRSEAKPARSPVADIGIVRKVA
jgi:hypothetical protein